MPVLLGTSGWQYRHWDGKFYPADLAKSAQLAWYTARFQIVEVNLTFYRLPEAAVFRSWVERVAVEFRHDSWYSESIREVLERHGAALCLADRGGHAITPEWRTAEWGYLQFHGGPADPPGCYDRPVLRRWAARVADLWGPDGEVHVFFNNDFYGCALRDAIWFAQAAADLQRS